MSFESKFKHKISIGYKVKKVYAIEHIIVICYNPIDKYFKNKLTYSAQWNPFKRADTE